MRQPRAKHTQRLERILRVLDAGKTPFAVNSLHVFGSYARGALFLGDLDLLIIHEPIPKQMLDQWCKHYEEEHLYSEMDAWDRATRRCMSALRRSIQKPGEPMDILFGTDLKQRLDGLLGRADVRLLWSTEDRNWKSKLGAILPDPNAAPAQRDHLLSLKRLNTNRSTMELIVDGLKHDELKLTRIAIESMDVRLSPRNANRLATEIEFGGFGKESVKLLPIVFAWLQSRRQQVNYIDGHELSVWSVSRTHLIEFGKPDLWHAVWYLRRVKKLKKVAFVAHLKKDQPNDILVFERGPNWATEKMEQRERERKR